MRKCCRRPGGLTIAPSDARDRATVAAADHASRHWTADDPGPLPPGTEAHKQAAGRMFRETFNPYKPTIIDWPKLSDEERDRLVSLPIWDIAVQTEGKARLRMLSYANSLADPDWREAIELNGWEEGRHKAVLSNLVAAYGIALEPEPAYIEPRDTEWAYLVTGFSECIDSFFAFGLFALAKRSGFFPPELVDTFEPVMQEECRHILLFANWLAWQRRNMPWWRRPWFELRVAAVWVFLGWERIGIARGMDDGKGNAAGQQLHRHRQQGGQRRGCQRARADGAVPGGERPPLRRLRRAAAAPDDDAEPGPLRAALHAHTEGEASPVAWNSAANSASSGTQSWWNALRFSPYDFVLPISGA